VLNTISIAPSQNAVIPKRSEGSAFHAPETALTREDNCNNEGFVRARL